MRIILIVLVLGAAVLVWVEFRDDGSRRLQPASDEQEVAPGFSLGESEDTDKVTQTTYTSDKGVELIVTSPEPNAVITSPLTVTGEAPGFWFFEATFPIIVVNWDGLIIGEGYAQAQDDPDTTVGAGWMTEQMVSFVGTVEFYEPLAEEGRQAIVGGLILQRSNPSGLSENDDAIEFSIRFSR